MVTCSPAVNITTPFATTSAAIVALVPGWISAISATLPEAACIENLSAILPESSA